jgi:hypothetical protein
MEDGMLPARWNLRRAWVAIGLLLPWLAAAQVDVAKALVGKWEGRVGREIQGPELPPERILVISAVREQDGKWVAEARYGIPGRNLGKVEPTVQVTGNDILVEFVSPGIRGGSQVQLRLQGERVLIGTLRPVGSNRAGELRMERAAQ